MQDRTPLEGDFCHATSALYQGAHGGIAAQVVMTGVEDRPFDGDGVLITRQDGIDGQRVAIGQLEACHLKLGDIISRIMIACHTVQADRLLIGSRGEATGIFEEGGDTLVLLHLIGHRALDKACDIDDAVEGTDHDDIVVG